VKSGSGILQKEKHRHLRDTINNRATSTLGPGGSHFSKRSSLLTLGEYKIHSRTMEFLPRLKRQTKPEPQQNMEHPPSTPSAGKTKVWSQEPNTCFNLGWLFLPMENSLHTFRDPFRVRRAGDKNKNKTHHTTFQGFDNTIYMNHSNTRY
jgi:hypothetical protein